MAALSSALSPFLNLPPELRMEIYLELLTTAGAITLYHDQTGREPSLGLCPAFLRVSRQVYNESAWLLYERNGFLISLTTEIDKRCISSSRRRQNRQYRQRDGLPTPRKPDLFRIKDDSTGEERGLIYPHCFRRFRHIGLVTAGDAVRGLKLNMPFFSNTYKLIIDILGCLAARDGFDWTLGTSEPSDAGPEMEKQAEKEAAKPPSHQKSLDFVMLRHEMITDLRPSCDFKEMDKMANLLAEVKRKRDLVAKNMDVCMQSVAQCQIEFRILQDRRQELMQRCRRMMSS